jgi:hypothetical protein
MYPHRWSSGGWDFAKGILPYTGNWGGARASLRPALSHIHGTCLGGGKHPNSSLSFITTSLTLKSCSYHDLPNALLKLLEDFATPRFLGFP